MKYKFYRTSEQAWHAMFEAVREAKKTIYLESFILTDDPITHHLFETLKNKAREGLRVKIIVDRVGHLWYGSVNKDDFEAAGAEVLFFNRWFYRSHRKILVIDGATAFLGGVNVRGEYAKWLDLHVRLTGLLVRSLLHSFCRVYALAGGRDPAILEILRSAKVPKARKVLYRAKSCLIEHSPIKGRGVLRDYYRKKCGEAKKNIIIVTPYFIPHRWVVRVLRAAARRGVKIEVIIPSQTDTWLADQAHRVFAPDFQDFISFYFLPEMNHAKVLLIDEREGMIGSNNLDARSFDFNLEASISFQRKDMIGDLKTILETWKKAAIPFVAAAYKKRWYDFLIRALVDILRPIL